MDLAERVGARGLVALGVFGEAAALSSAEQASVLATVTAATELPVVAGLPGRTTAVAVEQARGCLDAASRPLRAVMVQAHTANADLLVEHLARRSTGRPVRRWCSRTTRSSPG